MRVVVRIFLITLAGLFPSIASAQVGKLYAIGDLPGGPSISVVRDATKHDGVIYAVGGSAQNPQVLCFPTPTPGCLNQSQFNTDTPVLWKFDGTTATLIALPPFANNTTANNNVVASAITRDATYIAGQARLSSANAQAQAMRVTVTPGGFTDLRNLATLIPALPASTNAASVSADGSVLYGTQALAGATRATRFDVTAGTTSVIPLLPDTTNNQPAFRGVSSDGSVMVGTSFTTPYWGTTNGTAFRYVQGVGVSTIPLFPGATWSKALAVSPDGNLTLVAANSTVYPAGAMFLHDASANVTTPLRLPNTPYIPFNQASMTADGSVLVVSYLAVVPAGFTADRLSYFHNSHGWFNIDAALRDAGVHLSPTWNADLTVNGMSPDGTLVYGFGFHPDGTQEGFVAEFPLGYLANYQAPRSAPDPAVVGAYFNPDPNHPGLGSAMAFLADGSFYFAEAGHPSNANDPNPNGFERGAVGTDASGKVKITLLQDTGGSAGFSGIEPETFTVTATDDALHVVFPFEACGDPDPANCTFTIPRIGGGPASIVGGWVQGNPALDDSSAVLWLLNDGTFFFADDGPGGANADGIEHGTYTWDPLTHVFTVTISNPLEDTNGPGGLSSQFGTRRIVLAADGLSATISDNLSSTLMYRIGAPAKAKISLNGFAPPAGITVGGGATISVGVTNGPGLPGDWVALAAHDAPAGSYVAWKYLNDSRTRPATGLATATVTFTVPDGPGVYEVRLFRNDTPTLLATSGAIAVTTTTLAVNGVVAPGGIAVAGGAALTVNVTNGPGQPGDWLVLADTSAAPGTYVVWKYLNDSHTRPLSGLSTATVTFTAPTPTGSYVVRLLRNDTQTVVATSGGIAVATTTVAVNGNAPGSGASVTSTAPLTVVVTNGPGLAGDWVGLAKIGAPAATYIDWKYLNDSRTRPAAGLATATVTFTAPVAGGSYEVRLLRNDTQVVAASSGPITVAESSLSVNGAAAPAGITVGTAGFVTIGVTNAPGLAGDWVALAAVGSPASSYVAWNYLNNSHTRPASGSMAAMVTLAAPATPGAYEVRLFRNDSFTLVAKSGAISAAAAAIAVNGGAAGAGITVAANETITVSLTNGPAQPGDWLVLASVGSPAGSYTAWKYLNDSHAHPVSGVASAVVTFTAPAALGQYQIRLFRNDTLLQVATSGTITVAPTTLRLNGQSTAILAPAGAPITVDVVNGPGQPGDWVVLTAASAPPGSYVSWRYLNDSHTRPLSGLIAATVTLTAPATAGTYQVRLYRNDTLTFIAASAAITVP